MSDSFLYYCTFDYWVLFFDMLISQPRVILTFPELPLPRELILELWELGNILFRGCLGLHNQSFIITFTPHVEFTEKKPTTKQTIHLEFLTYLHTIHKISQKSFPSITSPPKSSEISLARIPISSKYIYKIYNYFSETNAHLSLIGPSPRLVSLISNSLQVCSLALLLSHFLFVLTNKIIAYVFTTIGLASLQSFHQPLCFFFLSLPFTEMGSLIGMPMAFDTFIDARFFWRRDGYCRPACRHDDAKAPVSR